jgi:UMF1 family MFS transporter
MSANPLALAGLSEGQTRKIQRAWTMYDWANSVYSLVITTAIFPIFFNNVTTREVDGQRIDTVSFWGTELLNTQLYAYVLASSFLVVILLSPLLSGMADYAGKKRFFMQVFCYLGSASCASMYFFEPSKLEWSMLSLFLANIGFWGSLGFYNAFLPEIAPRSEQDRLGARGYIMGYLGSLLLLIICLGLILGVGPHMTRWAFVLVGVWWVAWAQWPFRYLPSNPYHHKPEGNLLLHGFQELRGVARELRGQPVLKRYLLSFFILSMALQTIMLMASSFGIKEVRLASDQLIVAIIAVQLLAIPGAFLVAHLSGRWGNLPTLMACISVWVGVCLYAYFGVKSVEGFYVAAGVIGFMMGGTQSLNRSTYAKMLPDTEDHASYFSFYEVLEKGGLIIGMFSWGYIEGFTGSMRDSILVLILFFGAALAVLMWGMRSKDPAGDGLARSLGH